MRHVLIVDEDKRSAEQMAAVAASVDMTCAIAHTLRSAQAQISMHKPDIAFVDLRLPDGSGRDLIDAAGPLAGAEVVVMSGTPSFDSSIEALRLRVADYLKKPVSETQLRAVLERLAPPAAFNREIGDLDHDVEQHGHFGPLWGRSAAIRGVYDRMARVARTAAAVLITGESGTGKEIVARTIHDLSRRRGAEFLAVNCGAISPKLIESELFGHEKGSFTGADRQHIGFFERADGGTLFLDEIGEMPAELQVKLLRVLETGALVRVGGTQSREIDVRIVAATNKSPLLAVDAGTLRADLFYRLNVFPIDVPPLRERLDDVALIALHFLRQISNVEGRAKEFAPAALARLADYRWPGNVRELRNIVYRAYLMAPGGLIVDPCLPDDDAMASTATATTVMAATLPSAAAAPGISLPLGISLKDVKRRVTVATFEHIGEHERTAAALGISDKSLALALKNHFAFEREAGVER
ncbi:MAG: sigma-54 dependent transcriptional regulator [Caldimonas sp.]